tara:strand:+ start:202 stop:330 length:129 start_codon:yes stop_codon:yes gene_type:complete
MEERRVALMKAFGGDTAESVKYYISPEKFEADHLLNLMHNLI